MTNGKSKLGHTRKSLDYWMFSEGGMVTTTITDPTRALGLTALIQHTARVRYRISSMLCCARRFQQHLSVEYHKLHTQDGRERESFEARTEYL